jgi:hypothetical protein
VERGGEEAAGVEEAVGGVEHPDGEEHCQGAGDREAQVDGSGGETGPEDGDGGGVEGEQVPEVEEADEPREWCRLAGGVCGFEGILDCSSFLLFRGYPPPSPGYPC